MLFTAEKHTEKKRHRDRNGILLPKLFWPTVRKNCSGDIQTVKGQNNAMFGKRMLF